MKFDVRYYLVAILFILFDLEVAFMLPWAVVFKDLGAYGFWSMLVFIVVLTIGFITNGKRCAGMGIEGVLKKVSSPPARIRC